MVIEKGLRVRIKMVSSYFLSSIFIIIGLVSMISLGVVAYKRKMSFGSIIAVIGAILIALGFAWLLAQNWHYIPSFFFTFLLTSKFLYKNDLLFQEMF